MEVLAQLVANSLIAGSLYALSAMSFNLMYGVSRSFNLAHGATGAIAAYTVFFLAKENGFPLSVSIFLALCMAAGAALALELLVFRPLRKKHASNLVLLIAALGASVAIEALIAIIFTSHFKTLSDVLGEPIIVSLFGASVSSVQLVMFVSALAIFFLFWWMLSATRFGKTVRAIADDEEVARIVGIDTNRIIALVFLIGGAVMGLSGILSGLDVGLEPHMGFLLLLTAAIAAIIGGIGNVYGAFWAAYLVGFIENFGVWFVGGEWKYAIAFSILILFLLFRPQGFFGKK